ncbi:hypothetical protein HMPREF9074_08318 [Capnocytophaga sp. oral taxon 329 str. F0087]|nr:hypothetical protein HMPREF9074_08318 [Capnocytophaga sp. oral taxon 329 str. F0087]
MVVSFFICNELFFSGRKDSNYERKKDEDNVIKYKKAVRKYSNSFFLR